MKKNKGFTLVELLAVIVILAIIMIISIPAVLNTMTSARKKTFGEYVTKVYDAAQKKYMSDEMSGNSKEYVKYDITKDLGLSNTGDFRGYVVFYRSGTKTDVYIGLSDNEYHTATQFGDDESNVVNYINYSIAGEPEYASSLVRFDGKNNSFTNGKVDEFYLPEPENVDDFVHLEPNLNPIEDFGLLLKNFRNQARRKYLDSKDKNDGLVYKAPINERDSNGNETNKGYTYVAGFSYESVFGPSDDKKGFVYMMELSPNAEVSGNNPFGNLRIEVIALKNNQYHTASNVTMPDMTSDTPAYIDNITPLNIIITFDNVSFNYKPEKTDHLSTFNFIDLFENIETRVVTELDLKEDACSCVLTETQKEQVIRIISQSLSTDLEPAQQYVVEGFSDGLDDSYFDLTNYASRTDSPLIFMNPKQLTLINTEQPMD